jgi:hypothetical protein
MGTWGTTAFEDDTALGYYDEFCSSEQSVKDLEIAFDTVLATNYNMDELLLEGFTEPVKALVYAEIIAAAVDKPGDKYPDAVYHSDMGTPVINVSKIGKEISPSLRTKAAQVLTKIRDAKDIHLTVLWLESESFDEWKNYVSDLIDRVK